MKEKHQVRCHSSNGVIKFLFMFPIFKYLRWNQLLDCWLWILMISLNSTCVQNTETWIQCYNVQLTTNDFMDAFITRIFAIWWQFSLSQWNFNFAQKKNIQSVPFSRGVRYFAMDQIALTISTWHQAKPK